MDPDTRGLVRALRPGFSAVPVPRRPRRWLVVDEHGNPLMNGGKPIVLGKNVTTSSKARLRAQLEAVGAIESRYRRAGR